MYVHDIHCSPCLHILLAMYHKQHPKSSGGRTNTQQLCSSGTLIALPSSSLSGASQWLVAEPLI